MKKKLVMLLIGSMILGMVGCTNKGNETIDNNKETIQEPETTETEPETEKIDATVDELLGNVIFCDFNKTVYTADGVGKLMFIPGKVDFELSYKTVTVYDSEVEYEEFENKFKMDMDAYKEVLSKAYEENFDKEEEFEDYYAEVVEMLGFVDGYLTEKCEGYRYFSEDGWIFAVYDEEEKRWDCTNEEDHLKDELLVIVECCKEAEISKTKDGYVLTANVVNDELMEAIGYYARGKEVEIKLYFDSNKTFMKYIISSENFERLDMVYDSLVLCCEFSNDFEGELVLPSDIKEYE